MVDSVPLAWLRVAALHEDPNVAVRRAFLRFDGCARSGMTQIMKLLDLAPDIQEQILFLPAIKGLKREKPAAPRQPDRLARAAAPVSEVK